MQRLRLCYYMLLLANVPETHEYFRKRPIRLNPTLVCHMSTRCQLLLSAEIRGSSIRIASHNEVHYAVFFPKQVLIFRQFFIKKNDFNG